MVLVGVQRPGVGVVVCGCVHHAGVALLRHNLNGMTLHQRRKRRAHVLLPVIRPHHKQAQRAAALLTSEQQLLPVAGGHTAAVRLRTEAGKYMVERTVRPVVPHLPVSCFSVPSRLSGCWGSGTGGSYPTALPPASAQMPAPASSSANAAQSHTRRRFLPPLDGGATTDRRSIWLAVQQGQKEASSGSTAPHLIQYFSFSQ